RRQAVDVLLGLFRRRAEELVVRAAVLGLDRIEARRRHHRLVRQLVRLGGGILAGDLRLLGGANRSLRLARLVERLLARVAQVLALGGELLAQLLLMLLLLALDFGRA